MFQKKIKTNIWFFSHITNLSSFQSFAVIRHKADKKIGIRKITDVLLNLSETHYNIIDKTKKSKEQTWGCSLIARIEAK